MTVHVTRIELAVNTFQLGVSIIHFSLQPTVPDVKMFHLAHFSCVAERSCNIRMNVPNDWKEAHSTDLEIVLRLFGLFQQLARAHDFRRLQCWVRVVQSSSLAHFSCVAERSCNIRMNVPNDWKEAHSTDLEIVLRLFGLFQQLARAHDFRRLQCWVRVVQSSCCGCAIGSHPP